MALYILLCESIGCLLRVCVSVSAQMNQWMREKREIYRYVKVNMIVCTLAKMLRLNWFWQRISLDKLLIKSIWGKQFARNHTSIFLLIVFFLLFRCFLSFALFSTRLFTLYSVALNLMLAKAVTLKEEKKKHESIIL